MFGGLWLALRAGSLQPIHSGDQVCFRGLDQQVVVVSHPHPGVNGPAGFAACRTQRLHPAPPVADVREEGAGMVAPGRDMMPRQLRFDAQRSGHDGRQHGTRQHFRQAQYSNFPGPSARLRLGPRISPIDTNGCLGFRTHAEIF